MIQVLIVDDEAMTVNYMADSLAEWGGADKQMMTAYNGPDAYEKARGNRIDILLTDVSMPVMNGLELADKVKRLWPRCKVIFLSGHNDFAYIQVAMRQGGSDYVLKTEGDQAIVGALDKACMAIDRELRDGDILRKAMTEYTKLLPSLRRSYLQHYVRGEPEPAAARAAKFANLEMPLDAHLPVCLVLGEVDGWGEYGTYADKMLMLYAIGNITEELAGSAARIVFLTDDKLRLVWFVQPSPARGATTVLEAPEQGPAFAVVLQGMMESIQDTCRKLLRLPVSLAIGRECEWERASARFDSLLLLLRSVYDAQDEMLLIEGAEEEQTLVPDDSLFAEADFRTRMRRLETLEAELDRGDERAFAQLYDRLTAVDESLLGLRKRKYVMMEMFAHLNAFVLSYMNRRDLWPDDGDAADIDRRLLVDSYGSWQEMIAYFRQLGIVLARRNAARNQDNFDEIVRKVNRYVHDHLHGDLSLNRLAGVVHLNASYLSRMYKQKTGINLLDFITDARIAKAKELLKTTTLKIQDISLRIGVESPPYFTRMFKKAVNCTPQEYRAQS